ALLLERLAVEDIDDSLNGVLLEFLIGVELELHSKISLVRLFFTPHTSQANRTSIVCRSSILWEFQVVQDFKSVSARFGLILAPKENGAPMVFVRRKVLF